MDRIEFDASVEKGGVIHIPPEYKRELAPARKVHVAVTPEEDEPRTVKRMREHPFHVPEPHPEPETVKFMREHPLNAPGVKPLLREEIYNRTRK
jgi:hypothetical protein